MPNGYSIEPSENGFVVIDPWGEYLVRTFPTEEAAQRAIAECKREDDLSETANLLLDLATKTLMKTKNLDRETASRLIRDATGG
jgi:hypothetical protein